jgi:uroporphyrin-III C-methyltransferase / precorrin-2 dehydrogenase / sirohydrochlorin ferrochelatase
VTASVYPAFLRLRGRPCVVVGGGAVAEDKVLGLLDAGACVTVVSPQLSRRLEDLTEQGAIALLRRPYRAGDLAGAFLAIAATDDGAVNGAVWTEAEQRGILLNAVDDVPHCSFIAPSIHRQGDVTVAVSTAGKSPALAVRLRERIARAIGPEYATLADMLGRLRPEVQVRVPDARARTRLWYDIVDSDVMEFIRRGDVAGAERRIAELIAAVPGPVSPRVLTPLIPSPSGRGETKSDRRAPSPERRGGQGVRTGIVYLVGAGPGDPELITVRGLTVLQSADVVVYDRLIHPDLVDRAPPWAERVFVGKGPAGHCLRQEEINALLIATARTGRVVVRLKGGDPFVFGRGAEECEALHAAGVAFAVVPGVTAAVAAPGSAGIPVTHRGHGSAFAVVTGHECDGASDLDWGALARLPTLVFLMAVRALPEIVARLLAHGMGPGTPAALTASATLPNARTVVGTLATIADLAREARLEPPATLVVGEVVRVRERLVGSDESRLKPRLGPAAEAAAPARLRADAEPRVHSRASSAGAPFSVG